jgi:predicted cation transporter
MPQHLFAIKKNTLERLNIKMLATLIGNIIAVGLISFLISPVVLIIYMWNKM